MHLDMKLYSRSFLKICSVKGHKMNDSVVKVSMNKFYVTWNLKFKQTDTKIKTVYRDTACQWCKGSQKKPKENSLLQHRDINSEQARCAPCKISVQPRTFIMHAAISYLLAHLKRGSFHLTNLIPI